MILASRVLHAAATVGLSCVFPCGATLDMTTAPSTSSAMTTVPSFIPGITPVPGLLPAMGDAQGRTMLLPGAPPATATATSTTATTVTTATSTSTRSTLTTRTSTTVTTTTVTTTTVTSTTATSSTTTTSTLTTTTSSTTTSTTTTTPPLVHGSQATKTAYEGWLHQWRKMYKFGSPCGVVACPVPQPNEETLPRALRGVRAKVVDSEGGVAGGVVTEGMGYAIMIEGFEAAQGSKLGLNNGLAFVKSWLGMVRGPKGWAHPFGGGNPGDVSSALEVGTPPYGVSVIASNIPGLGGAGLASWKFPLDQCPGMCNGTASDGDQDAVLGMTYLAAALDYPADFVDMVMRSIIAFASADLGFPDLYRILPGGKKVFVPKMGSRWGGLTPPSGKFKTQQEPWCYSPGYFAPAHYRIFRDFAKRHWVRRFDVYLPGHLDGLASTLEELVEAFESAVTTGYNILYRSSCISGSVSNWVGVEAACEGDEAALSCPGVPWKHTPYVGPEKKKCFTSNTKFGQYGADASRTPWRIAMDYVLYRDESNSVTMYDRDGTEDATVAFGSQVYLNRMASQYKWHAKCDGGQPGECLAKESDPPYSPWRLAFAFDPEKKPPEGICENVPEKGDTWWAGYMAYPTFTSFVAPLADITPEESISWMETFASICRFEGGEPKGTICRKTYFDVSQAVIATMVMSRRVRRIDDPLLSMDTRGPIAMQAVAAPSRLRASGPEPLRWGSRLLAPPLAACLATLAVWLARVFGPETLRASQPYERLVHPSSSRVLLATPIPAPE